MAGNITKSPWMHLDEELMNGSWVDELMPPSLTHESFREMMESFGYDSLMAFGRVSKVLYGPVLWSICIAGAMMNFLVIVAELTSVVSAVSISIAAICICLTIRAANFLLLHDLQQS